MKSSRPFDAKHPLKVKKLVPHAAKSKASTFNAFDVASGDFGISAQRG